MAKKFLSLILITIILASFTTTAFASSTDENSGQQSFLLSTTTYEKPVFNIPSDTTELLLDKEQIESLSIEGIISFLQENTPCSQSEIIQLATYLKGDDFKNGIAPAYGIYDFPEWYVEPYIVKSSNIAVASSSWIAMDAYTSSIGMNLSSSRTLKISVSLGYTGSKEIKEKKSLTVQGSISHELSISESVFCPAWYYFAWRPYIVYREDVWEGVMEVTTIVPTALGVSQYVWYDDVEGTHETLVSKSTQAFSRENTTHDLNAVSPVPPIDPPNVAQP